MALTPTQPTAHGAVGAKEGNTELLPPPGFGSDPPLRVSASFA